MSTLEDSRLTTAQTADLLGVTTRTLEQWRHNRASGATNLPHGPEFIHIGRRVYYLRAEVLRYERTGERPRAVKPSAQEPIEKAPLLPLPSRVPMPR